MAASMTYFSNTVVITNILTCLTEPELSSRVSKAFNVLLPGFEEIHRAVLPPLENLQRAHTTHLFFFLTLKSFLKSAAESYRPASSVRLHVAPHGDKGSLFALRKDVHEAGRPDAVQQLLGAVGRERELQKSCGKTRPTLTP